MNSIILKTTDNLTFYTLVTGILMLFLSSTTQAADQYAHAKQLGKPNTKVMGCPKDGFWDPRNGGECWTCNGHARTLNPVTSGRACKIKARTHFSPASQIESNKNSCTGDSFFDPLTASCWTCPAGTKRTAHSVKSGKACSKRIAKKKRKAKYVYNTGSVLKSCKKGTFANVGSTKCYTCPGSWKHDPSKKVKKKGVCYKPAKTQWSVASNVKKINLACNTGFYDPINGGSCWSCPTGYKRQVTSVKSGSACIKIDAPRVTTASFITAKKFNAVKVAKGVTKLGCGTYGKSAFFDLKGGGTCWTCPSTHPTRTIFAVDNAKSCATNVCGKAGGRPCYVWERIPSCDAGLVEDPFTNTCVRPKNLACNAYVKTLAAMKKAMDKANAAGGALQEEALDRIPGARSLLKFSQNQMATAELVTQKLVENVNADQLLGPLQNLAVKDPEFISTFLSTAKDMAGKKAEITAMFLDHKLMCGGDLNKIVKRAMGLGIADLVKLQKQKKKRNSIQMASLGNGLEWPSILNDLEPEPMVLASRIAGKGSRNRVILDFTLNFPVQKGGAKFVFTPGFQIAISLEDPFKGDSGLYLMAGASFLAAKPKNPFDPGDAKTGFGGINVGIGFQWGGPDRFADHKCHKAGTVAVGGTIKIPPVFGVGINGCPIPLGGFGISIGTLNLGALDYVVSILDPTSTAAGSTPIVTPIEEKTRPRFKFAGALEGGAGPEISIRLLPWPNKVKDYRGGGIF